MYIRLYFSDKMIVQEHVESANEALERMHEQKAAWLGVICLDRQYGVRDICRITRERGKVQSLLRVQKLSFNHPALKGLSYFYSDEKIIPVLQQLMLQDAA